MEKTNTRATGARIEALVYILERLAHDETDLKALKNETARKFGLERVLKNSEILAYARISGLEKRLLQLLKKRPMRTLSGVTPIAVMIKPQGSCNWGCVYCPFTGKAAKSYTGEEPAALRARDNAFDPYRQVQSRLKQFESTGHPTDKCEVIVMGGTFLAMDKSYKTYFIKAIYDALNERPSRNIVEAKTINEKATHRMIGLTLETRPDVCVPHLDEILGYGATRVELGVQHPDDAIYAATNRGHGTKEVVDATRTLKDAAFKVLYHIMPGLPGSSPQKDVAMVKQLFGDERFRPDMLKIYPTLVIPGTKLFQMQRAGKYQPYNSEEAAEVISECYRYIPRYVRVMRIQRDIPATRIHEGVKKSNLRELVEDAVERKGIPVHEIRYREVGLRGKREGNGKSGAAFQLECMEYGASGGQEVFLSFENERCIAGFIRLRIPEQSTRPEIDPKTALIRELHVYGQEVPLAEDVDAGTGAAQTIQHRGLGSRLLAEAERIAKEEFDRRKMVVISGVGVREYYYRQGYAVRGPYVSKAL